MRVSNLELPSANELRQMIAKESQRRAVHRDYLATHPEVFLIYRKLCQEFSIDMSILDELTHHSFDESISMIETLNESMVQCIAKNRDSDLYPILYQQLHYEVEPRESDGIFVFGSPGDRRIKKAVELYHSELAPRIIVTGAAPHWATHEISEAERTKLFAIDHGVPEDSIIVENRSIATPDNVKRSIDLWESIGWHPQKVILVTAGFNLRRAYMDMYKFSPWKIVIYSVAADGSEGLSQDNWAKSDRGRRIVLNEYAKLLIETKIDQVLAEGGL